MRQLVLGDFEKIAEEQEEATSKSRIRDKSLKVSTGRVRPTKTDDHSSDAVPGR